MIEGSIQEDITLINIYACNIGAPKYIKQMLTDIKGENDSDTIIVGEFNTASTSMDRSSRQKINKTLTLNDTLYQMTTYIYIKHFIQRSRIHILFKCTWNILQDITC